MLPSWSFGFELIVRYLRLDWNETASWDARKKRTDLDARPYPQAMVRRVQTRAAELRGVPARWFVPPGAPERVATLYLHGGSYAYGSACTTHADVIARLALASGIIAVGIDYRLAPEHVYPAQLEDALRAWDALVAEGYRVLLAGDSAGGNLALALQLALRDRGREQSAACALISPWSDLTMPGRSFVDNDAFDYGTRAVLADEARAFAGGIPLDDPRLSPVRANLRGLAPVLVVVGGVELPRDDIFALADALGRAGVEVTRHVAPELPHNPPVFAAYHPAAAASLDAVAAFIRRHASA